MRRQLRAVNADLETGRVSVEQWRARFYKAVYDGHRGAAILGRARAGQTQVDLTEMDAAARAAADDETRFLNGFASALKSKDSRYVSDSGKIRPGSLEARTDLYAGKLRGTANDQFGEGSPDGSTFTWLLGIEEHCDDCPRIASHIKDSPWEAVYTTPGAGDSACLGHCGCELHRNDGVKAFANEGAHQIDRKQQAGGRDKGQNDQPVQAPPSAMPATSGNLEKAFQPSADMKPYMDEAMSAITKLLDIPEPKISIPVTSEHFRLGQLGGFKFVPSTKEFSIGLDLKQCGARIPTTLVHEIGHAVDDVLFESGTVMSSLSEKGFNGTGPFKQWADKIKASKVYAELNKALKLPLLPDERRHVEYLLEPFEFWARSFTQYVVRKSNAPKLTASWKDELHYFEVVGRKVAYNWEDSDFLEIEKALDELFARKN